ncbi:MAG: hypothetical protein methR_P3782 [Methyloprofundus sp.]|nr:MAG: hypothetical protein methR_P3782 [Methyloprofundus sp.]
MRILYLNLSYWLNKRFIPNTSKLLLSLLLVFGITQTCPADDDLFQQNTLRTGFYLESFPDISLADMEIALRFWVEEVGNGVGIPASIFIYKDLDKMRTDFYQGKINFIVSSPLFIVNEFDLQQLAEGYKIVLSDIATDKILVITHKSSDIQNLKDLGNTQLTLLLNDPIAKMYAEVLSLENYGKNATNVFSRINYTLKSNQLIYKLFFKNTDVIFVYQQAYQLAIELNPQIKDKTLVIAALPDIPRGLGYFHKKVNPEFREAVLTEVEKLDTHPRGQQLLALFQAETVRRSNLGDLKTTQQLKQRYQKLINAQ